MASRSSRSSETSQHRRLSSVVAGTSTAEPLVSGNNGSVDEAQLSSSMSHRNNSNHSIDALLIDPLRFPGALSSSQAHRREAAAAGLTTASSTSKIVHNIASFLTISDVAASSALSATPGHDGYDDHPNDQQQHMQTNQAQYWEQTYNDLDQQHQQCYKNQCDDELLSLADSWAVGMAFEAEEEQFSRSSTALSNIDNMTIMMMSIDTPPTPALVEISPPTDLIGESANFARSGWGNPQGDQDEEQYGHITISPLHDAVGMTPPPAHAARSSLNRKKRPSGQRFENIRSDPDQQSRHGQKTNRQHHSMTDAEMQLILQQRRRKWAQEKITAAVFAHPQPLRTYCLQAVQAAQALQQQRAQQQELQRRAATQVDPETCIEPIVSVPLVVTKPQPISELERRIRVVVKWVETFLRNAPLTVLWQLAETLGGLGLDMIHATWNLTTMSVQGLASLLHSIWHAILHCNPLQLLEAVISLQFNAMGRTSEVLASGIQSVATNVGSASSMALHRLHQGKSASLSSSASSISFVSLSIPMGGGGAGAGFLAAGASHNVSGNNLGATGATGTSGGLGAASTAISKTGTATTTKIHQNRKLLKKLSSINDAARVLAYKEVDDDTGGGLPRHAISRTRRMMHYSVSLRPFFATVSVPPQVSSPRNSATETTSAMVTSRQQRQLQSHERHNSHSSVSRNESSSAVALSCELEVAEAGSSGSSSTTVTTNSSPASPFMCTPQSFPPTPHSRQMVMVQTSRFADDVLFLARDRLRVHDGLESSNARTRAMARALLQGERLAIFDANADPAASGIQLSCGQHVATKVGNMYYASARSMVPVLRNCYVYFEMTVLPPASIGDLHLHAAMATLSIGLSTAEMPPNTLIGACEGSVGLCTTGQVLRAGQWLCPATTSTSGTCMYSTGATVGCLVCLQDAASYETWDGKMVSCNITYSVNGQLVPPPLPEAVQAATSSSDRASAGGSIIPPPPPGSLRNHTLRNQQHARPPPWRTAAMPSGQNDRFNTANALPPIARYGSSPPPPINAQAAVSRASTITCSLLVPAAEDLYPTVTLQSAATSVMCHLSAQDVMLAHSRAAIGVLDRYAAVYAVDGSVIFEEGPDDLEIPNDGTY